MSFEERQIAQAPLAVPTVATSKFSPRYPENDDVMSDERAEGRIIQAVIDAANEPIAEETILSVTQQLGLSISDKRIASHCRFACNETNNTRREPWCVRLPDGRGRSTGCAPCFRAHFTDEAADTIEAAVKSALAQ